MIVRIVWGKLKPGCWEDFRLAYKNACEMSANTPGLKARWLSRDCDDENAIYSITLWDSEEALLSYANSKLTREKLFPMIEVYSTGTYSMDVAEVEFSDHFGAMAKTPEKVLEA